MKKLFVLSAFALLLWFVGCKKEEIKYNVFTNDKTILNGDSLPGDSLPNDTLPVDTTTPPAGCDTTSVTFSENIALIFQQNCVSCHNPDYVDEEDDDDDDDEDKGLEPYLMNYAQIKHAINDDPSDFFKMIKHRGGEDPMPPTYKLSDCQIRQLEIWYANGMPNN